MTVCCMVVLLLSSACALRHAQCKIDALQLGYVRGGSGFTAHICALRCSCILPYHRRTDMAVDLGAVRVYRSARGQVHGIGHAYLARRDLRASQDIEDEVCSILVVI